MLGVCLLFPMTAWADFKVPPPNLPNVEDKYLIFDDSEIITNSDGIFLPISRLGSGQAG